MYASAGIALVAPFSRGNITIISNDTMNYPVVNPNLLSDPNLFFCCIAQYLYIYSWNESVLTGQFYFSIHSEFRHGLQLYGYIDLIKGKTRSGNYALV
jgi:hypothetical protein